MLPESITHEDMWRAYKRWIQYCDREFGHFLGEDAPGWHDFIGCNFDWSDEVMWLPPEAKHLIDAFNGPHWFAVMKARHIKLDEH